MAIPLVESKASRRRICAVTARSSRGFSVAGLSEAGFLEVGLSEVTDLGYSELGQTNRKHYVTNRRAVSASTALPIGSTVSSMSKIGV
jgi:hypothetical protein